MRLKQLILLAVTSAVPMLIQAGVDYRYPAPSGMHPAWYQQMAPAPQWRPRGYYQPRIPAAYMARPMPRPVYQAPQMNNKLQQKQWPAPKGFYRPLPPQQSMQQRNRQMQQAMQQRYRQMAPWQRGAYGMNRYNRYPAPAVRQPMMWQPRMNQAMPYYVPAPRYVAPTNFRHQAYRPPYSVNPWRQHSVQAFRPNNAWRQQPPVYRAPARQPVQPWRYSYQQNRLSMYGPVTRLSYLR